MRMTQLFSFCFLLLSFFSFSQIVINEYSASNTSGTINDNKGNKSDWIELYNTTSSAVTIGGWNLSDNPTDFSKYSFPTGTSIPANGFFRIWCSGLGSNADVAGHTHTNFKLTQCNGDWIILSNGGVVVDSLKMRRTQNLHSRARVPDGTSTWKIFTSPTPNAPNLGTSYVAYAPTPALSVNAGFYSSTQNVSISATPPANITIYYTSNGDEPTSSSSVYSSPISVSSTGVLRSIALSSDPTVLPSFMETNTYFINETIDNRYGVVSVSGGSDLNTLMSGTQIKPKTHFEYFENNTFKTEGYGAADKHGNDSWAYDQRGIDVETMDEYGYNNAYKHKFFTDWKMGASNRKDFQHVILKAAASDNYSSSNNAGKPGCHMRDAFVQTYSFRKGLNLDGRRNKHALVFKNGAYWGLYELRESFEADYTDYYYKQPSDSIDNLAFWGSLQIRNGSDTGWVALYNYIMANSMTNAGNYNSVAGRLNFMSLIDYMIYNSYVVNSDFVNWNSAWWRGRAKDGPIQKWKYWNWDMDNVYDLGENFSGLPTTDMNSSPCDYTNTFQNAGPNMGHPDMLEKLLTNPNFKSMYINRYADLLNSAFKCDSILNHFNHFKSILTPEMPRQIAKWGGTLTEWNSNMNNLESKIQARCTFIESKIADCYSVTVSPLTVDVDPPGAGIVKLNSMVLPYYKWSGTYFAPTVLSFTQTVVDPNLYEFDYWEFKNHTPSPNNHADSVSITYATSDDVIAHYKEKSSEVMFPTAFSPNGDGKNDELIPLGTRYVSTISVQIWNRWGERVYYSIDKDKGWDGRYKGAEAPTGVYAYLIKYASALGDEKTVKGNITLLR